MLITRFLVTSGEITSRVVLNTDEMDPDRLEGARLDLACAEANPEAVPIAGEKGDEVSLGMGMPPVDWERELSGDELQEIQESLVESAPTARRMMFYLNYQGFFLWFMVVRPDSKEPPVEIQGAIMGAWGGVERRKETWTEPSPEEFAVMERRLEELAREIWEARPALLGFTTWSDGWDEYIAFLAAAMLLEP